MPVDWTARLGGDDWSLQGLEVWFTRGRHRVSRDQDGQYYLTSPDLTACGTEDEAYKLAERIVGHINSAATVLEPGLRPVNVAAILEPGGRRHHYLRGGAGALVVRGERPTVVITRADGTVETSPPPLAERLVGLLESEKPDSAVARAVEQWSLPEQTPTSLNNILENIREDIWGGVPKDGEGRQAWTQMAGTLAPAMAMSVQQLDDELRRCRKSLQSQMAVGSLARHGSAMPVTNPMNLREAEDFAHRLVLVWLRGKV